MTLKEIITQLDIMACAVYGDDAWIGANKVTGYSVWSNHDDCVLSSASLDEIKAFLIQENTDSQNRFNEALGKIEKG